MRASIRWLSEILDVELDAAAVAERLTQAGVEIDDVLVPQVPGSDIVTASVIQRDPHPSRSDLFVVRVDAGDGVHDVVCGAPNTPGPGACVVLALPGSVVRGRKIGSRELAGVRSDGMLCSEAELEIGPDESGIIILDQEARPGIPLASHIDLDDRILEFSITPNRPDCLGHLGLAREVAAVLGLTFRSPVPDLEADELDVDVEDLATVTIEDNGGCPRYTAAVVQGVRVAPSPFAFRYRLHLLGVRPISNIVDVTNWILLRDNQPLHAFDRRLLPDGAVIVRRALPGESIVTLDEVERKLDVKDLVIASKDRSVAVAGVMGGEGTSITSDTSDVLIECAYFNPGSIRRTSARLHLQSESSYRFERGTDPSPLPEIVRHAASMMVRFAGGGVARGIVDAYPERIRPFRIPLRIPRVEKILGTPFTAGECKDSLLRLGCIVEDAGEQLEIAVPTHRPDLTREIDLIEEVARLRGYDTIPSTFPCIQASKPERAGYDDILRLKRAMAATGLDEVVTLSFTSSTRLSELGIPGEPVTLANPLSSDRDVMRTSLVPGLLDVLSYHLSRSRSPLRVFEVGSVFQLINGGVVEGIKESRQCAGLVFGTRPAWIGERRGHADFHDAWGAVLHSLKVLWDREPTLQRLVAPAPWLHPRSACNIAAAGDVIGWVGELHPRLARELDLPVERDALSVPVGLFEFEVTLEPSRVPRFVAYSDMPYSERDLAMVFPESVEVGAILDIVRQRSGDLLEDAHIFDVYRGERLEPGMKSVAFRILMRDRERTLMQEEVDELVANLVSDLERTLKGRIRG